MRTLPNGWGWKKLGEICDIYNGSTPSRNKKEYWCGDILWATPTDVSNLNAKYIDDTKEKITKEGYESCSTHLLPAGAVIFTSRASIGYIAITKKPLCTNQGFKNFICKPDLLPEFLLYCLRNRKKEIENLSSGSTFKEISMAAIKHFEIPLPPLPIQKSIVAILERAESLKRKREESNEETDTIIKSIFNEMFGDPVRNEKGWPVKIVSDVTISHDSKRVPIKASSREKTIGQYPYYGASGIIDYVDNYIFDFETILIAEDGANLISRSTPIAFKATGKYWVNNHAHVLTTNEQLNKEFFLLFFNLLDLTPYLTGSAQPKLNAGALNGIEIIVPPLSLQNQFASIVERIESLKEKQKDSTSDINNLFDALMQRAFDGELSSG